LEKDERTRLTTLRLYRLLQRQITEFDNKAPGNDSVLLQPILEAPDWGRHVIFKPSSPTQTEELFRLFYVWNDSAGEHGIGVISSKNMNEDSTATPSSISTNTGRASTSIYSSDSYTPSSIDHWYHELVMKPSGDTNEDDDTSTALPPMTSMTCWTSQKQIRDAVRTAFRSLNYDGNPTISLLTATDLHKWAILAIQNLREQQTLWKHSSVATTDGVVRIVATSRCIGTSMPSPASMPPSVITPQILADSTPKYRFAYRIRVENVSDDQTIQLMGRYWHISEEPPAMTSSISDIDPPPPIVVDSPSTGAVGQLPVLHPGQVFEYMSGTDLATPKGTMKGHLYMARVPSSARSAQSGDNVEALLKQKQKQHPEGEMEENDDFAEDFRLFEATVAPFPLEADS
jgi:uncharacterized protein affecting Mg2+/Co2+ transport